MTTILAGILCEAQRDAMILAAGTRIALPPDLSAKDVPVGSQQPERPGAYRRIGGS